MNRELLYMRLLKYHAWRPTSLTLTAIDNHAMTFDVLECSRCQCIPVKFAYCSKRGLFKRIMWWIPLNCFYRDTVSNAFHYIEVPQKLLIRIDSSKQRNLDNVLRSKRNYERVIGNATDRNLLDVASGQIHCIMETKLNPLSNTNCAKLQ